MGAVAQDKAWEEIRSWHRRQAIAVLWCVVSLLGFCLATVSLLFALQLPFTAVDLGLHWAPQTGQVYAVAAESTAEQAGFQAGDRIIAFVRSPHSSVVQVVVRGRQHHVRTLAAVVPSTGDLLRRLIPMLVVLGLNVISFVIWSHKPYDQAVTLFLACNQLGAIGIAFERLLLLFPLTNWMYVLHVSCIAFCSAAMVHAHIIFPQRLPIRAVRWLAALLYGVAACISAAALLAERWLMLEEVASNGTRLFAMSALLLSGGLLVQRFRRSEATERRYMKAIVLATCAAATTLAAFTLLPDLLLGHPLIPYEMNYALIVCIPLSYVLPVFRHDVLQVGRIVNRRVVHLTAGCLVGVGYFSGGVVLASDANVGLISPAWRSVVLVVLAVAFAPLYRFALRGVDSLLYGGWYDPQQLLHTIARDLNGVGDRGGLAQLLAHHLRSTMRFNTVLTLVHAPNEHLAPAGAAAERIGAEVIGIPLGGAFARLLLRSGRPLATAEVQTALSKVPLLPTEANWLAGAAAAGVELWVPLVARDQLCGVLLVGKRSDTEPFTLEDRQTLAVIGEQAALAAENVALFERLHAHIDQVEEMRATLEATVAERTAELRRFSDEREARGLAQSREVGAVAHDLKHDLEHIRTYLQMLLTLAKPDDTNQGFLEQLRTTVERTLDEHTALLDDMLLAALLQQNQLVLHPGSVELIALVARVVGQFELQYAAQQCALSISVEGDLATAWCDERRIERVLRNLLLNALNFTSGTRSDAAVVVMLHADDCLVYCTVQDNGAGIEPEPLHELQLACANAADGRVRPQGMGVGLRWSARLLTLSGGGLVITSPGRGRGTTVSLRLPRYASQEEENAND